MIEPTDLDKIPTTHRHTIGLWITERATQIQPSIALTAETAAVIRDVLWGVAADLVDPLSEDTTLVHALDVLRRVAEPVAATCEICGAQSGDIGQHQRDYPNGSCR